MNNEQRAELERLERVLAVAKRNGNELFIQNIEREIAAVQRGEHSPLIEEYLTAEERASRGADNQPGDGNQLKGTPSQHSILQAVKAMRFNADDCVH